MLTASQIGPRARCDGHPVARLADPDRRSSGQFRAGKDLAARDQHIVLPTGTGSRSGPGAACRPWRRWFPFREAEGNPRRNVTASGRVVSPASRRACKQSRRVLGEVLGHDGELVGIGGRFGVSYRTICGTLPSRHWAVARLLPVISTWTGSSRLPAQSSRNWKGSQRVSASPSPGSRVLDGDVVRRLPSR